MRTFIERRFESVNPLFAAEGEHRTLNERAADAADEAEEVEELMLAPRPKPFGACVRARSYSHTGLHHRDIGPSRLTTCHWAELSFQAAVKELRYEVAKLCLLSRQAPSTALAVALLCAVLHFDKSVAAVRARAQRVGARAFGAQVLSAAGAAAVARALQRTRP